VTLGLHMLEEKSRTAWGSSISTNKKIPLTYDALPMPLPSNKLLEQTHPLIFVSIASYRDSECQHTIQSLFAAARYPNRIRVGVCFQYDTKSDANCFSTIPMIQPCQVKVMHVPASEACGPCWARHLTEQLYDGEEYVLQLDSHMRLRPNWDIYLVHALSLCPTERAVLTSYPLGYELPNNVPKDDVDVIILCADRFDEDGMLRIKGKRLRTIRAATTTATTATNVQISPPCPSLFWASGFSFSKGLLLREVPYDPDLPHLFFGEEISMALRMYTHGWNTFTPMDAVVYHLWDRSYRPTVREQFSTAKQQEKIRSQQKVLSLLGMTDQVAVSNIMQYGLGTSRTLQEFEKYCGVSFCDRVIHKQATRGGQDDGAYRDDTKSSAEQVMKLLQMQGLLSGF